MRRISRRESPESSIHQRWYRMRSVAVLTTVGYLIILGMGPCCPLRARRKLRFDRGFSVAASGATRMQEPGDREIVCREEVR